MEYEQTTSHPSLERDMPKDSGVIHEAVAVFDDPLHLQDAIEELQRNGFMLQELSVLADKQAVKEKVGHVYYSVDEAKHDHNAPRTVFVPDEVLGSAEGAAIGVPLFFGAAIGSCIAAAAVGTLPVVMAAAVLSGAGGAGVGAVFARYIQKHHADYIRDSLERGGLLLWVNLRSKEQEDKAREILARHTSHDVHINESFHVDPTTDVAPSPLRDA